MDLSDDARSLHPDLVALRRALHREPEIGLELPRTRDRVLTALQGLPLEITEGTATTSVTAVLRGTATRDGAGPVVLLRGDMDGLPVAENSGEDFAAGTGTMHACGHDLHTSALVGAAQLLCAHRDRLAGDVVFMFQPGEEGWDGAGRMIDEGVLTAAGRRADHAYGLHVFANRLPAGVVTTRPGVFLSASHGLDVTVHGAGGHGSNPHTARDPIAAAAEMITSLRTMVTRRFDMFDPVVLTVGVVRAGTRRNVIPETARFEATVRSFSDAHARLLPQLVREVCDGVAAAHGVRAEVGWTDEYPRTVNDAGEVGFAAEVCAGLLGEERFAIATDPVSGSEDFSRVLDAIPGAFLGMGACPTGTDPAGAPMNHSPLARFDDAVLGDAAALHASLAAARLGVPA
ncbi:amidohydrolase [Pseudonocardia sp. EC080625-04]|uniref:M20 metallopeptidase family protein n=1 Tax=Pseudonocardia sp. EC080625-04 TaxID=1096868 RepID=UPI0006CB16E9|nr:M20 family metallopeptidase [Pseudonocardia sp. EC080625-04]ALE73097.1 amidohydrolase [Pseudonocardia sp. EC080625-04]